MARLIIKDAFWQILGRVISALGGFIVIKMITPFLGPLRFGDYNTVLKYFAIWSALADFGLYVIALREIGKIKSDHPDDAQAISIYYSKFVSSRIFNICIVYILALIVVYLGSWMVSSIRGYTTYLDNPYILRGLPIAMLFSAVFMISGIVSIPLQLYRQMQHSTISLIIARVSQIIFIYIIYISYIDGQSLWGFLLILLSVLVSGVAQTIYTLRAGRKFISLSWIWDWEFTRNHVIHNWRYGLSYYFSSFHILLVGIVLSIIYPTLDGWKYVGMRGLSMGLIEILLIIPSSLCNSMIHKISGLTDDAKKIAYGKLLRFMTWLGGFFAINFAVFHKQIIYYIAGSEYITYFENNILHIGSDRVLAGLSVVVVLTFIKQVYNYILVSRNQQNKLLGINGRGLAVGGSIGLYMIYHYGLVGGIICQILLEIIYAVGGAYVAYRADVSPSVDRVSFMILIIYICSIVGCGYQLMYIYNPSVYLSIYSILLFVVINISYVAVYIRKILGILREL